MYGIESSRPLEMAQISSYRETALPITNQPNQIKKNKQIKKKNLKRKSIVNHKLTKSTIIDKQTKWYKHRVQFLCVDFQYRLANGHKHLAKRTV